MSWLYFPVDSLRDIEPLLAEYFDYEWSMFNDAFEQVFNIYIQNGEYSPETEAQFLKVPSHKQSYIEALLIPSTNRLDSSKIHDTVMQVGKVLLLDFGDYDYNKLLQLYCDYLDEKTYTDMDMKIAHVFVFLTAIYQKYQQTNGFFGWEEALVNTTQAVYNTYVRPDMLKLYELFHEKKRIKSNSIRIEYNNEVINLDNFDNWFMNMITPYLDKYLGVSSLEEAQEELDRDYPNKGKRGRKKSNPVFDFILWRSSKILELSSFATPNVQINKSQADFLLKYLNFLGLLEEDSLKNDALNLRATLNNLKKNPPCFSWWNIPSDKQSPNRQGLPPSNSTCRHTIHSPNLPHEKNRPQSRRRTKRCNGRRHQMPRQKNRQTHMPIKKLNVA